MNINLISHIPTPRFLREKINNFRGNNDAIMNLYALNKAILSSRDDSRGHNNKPINNNFGNNFKPEVGNNNGCKISNRICTQDLWNERDHITIHPRKSQL